jgi:hypothetical protein
MSALPDVHVCAVCPTFVDTTGVGDGADATMPDRSALKGRPFAEALAAGHPFLEGMSDRYIHCPAKAEAMIGADMDQHHAAADKGTPDDRSRNQTRTTHDQSMDTDATGGADGRVGPRVEPALPHDLDESARSQASASAQHVDIGKQALADEMSPSEDTDRGPVLDKVYHEKVATDRGHTPPRQ